MKKILNLLMIIMLANMCALTHASSEPIKQSDLLIVGGGGLVITGLSLAALAIPTPNYAPHSACENLFLSSAALVGLFSTSIAVGAYIDQTPSKKEKELTKFNQDASDISSRIRRDDQNRLMDVDVTKDINFCQSQYLDLNYQLIDDRHVDGHPDLFPPQLIQERPDLKDTLKKYVWTNNHGGYRTVHPKFDTEIEGIRHDIQSKHEKAAVERKKLANKIGYTSLAVGAASALLCGAGIYKWWHGA